MEASSTNIMSAGPTRAFCSSFLGGPFSFSVELPTSCTLPRAACPSTHRLVPEEEEQPWDFLSLIPCQPGPHTRASLFLATVTTWTLTGSCLKKMREERVRRNHRRFHDFQPNPEEGREASYKGKKKSVTTWQAVDGWMQDPIPIEERCCQQAGRPRINGCERVEGFKQKA